ncbi:OmpR family response regulator RpaB [Paucibacter oligotrophus]|uniref:OmpR family response regulator RpaB n=1 Tax=Roseateles oligotrophus TaxID=1769250 RepID=A0A840L7G8_9BURK|nr:response regulator transcription factor [Roseateles oligotrophus]MBB4843996.1 OmpR family response regulator RpaB [Roseateles oligotrophus]
MPHLLLIDDDQALGPPLAQYLARFDFSLEQACKPSLGLQSLQTRAFDALILDGMLPEMDGFELCKRIRAGDWVFRNIPILMLTARGDLTDKVVGLELGADDYLAKPFEPRELAARLQTILRRVPPAVPLAASPVQRFEGLQIDSLRREARRGDVLLDLTGTEFELLLLLAREPGRVWHRDDILNQLRGQDADLYTRAVDILISRLRRKLEPLDAIKTLRNVGYSFALAALPA